MAINSHRNRSEGWTHAKLSGHQNELLAADLLARKGVHTFASRLGRGSERAEIQVGGLTEPSVPSLLGGSTKCKIDLRLGWEDGSSTGVSIKKSLGGQLFLVGTSRFLSGYEAHFGSIPKEVQTALDLFIGGPDALGVLKRLPTTSSKTRAYELRKQRLVWESLLLYDPVLAARLLEWFKSNISNIVRFCFSRGLAANPEDWASHVWYRNLLGEGSFDYLFSIEDIARGAARCKDCVRPGPRSGGSTILLPFGFLQWHQAKMQFHHCLETVKRLPQKA